MLSRFHSFSAVRIALEDFSPGGAVVVEPSGNAVELKSYAFAVVAIESVIVQIVTEFRRAVGGHFILGKATARMTSKFLVHIFALAPLHRQHPSAQQSPWTDVGARTSANDSINHIE